MAISVQCPGCGKKMKAGDQQAGKRIKCPGCGERIAIPKQDGKTESPVDVSPNPFSEMSFAKASDEVAPVSSRSEEQDVPIRWRTRVRSAFTGFMVGATTTFVGVTLVLFNKTFPLAEWLVMGVPFIGGVCGGIYNFFMSVEKQPASLSVAIRYWLVCVVAWLFAENIVLHRLILLDREISALVNPKENKDKYGMDVPRYTVTRVESNFNVQVILYEFRAFGSGGWGRITYKRGVYIFFMPIIPTSRDTHKEKTEAK